MRKQIISLLVAILVFVAMVPAAFAANNQQLAARLEGDSTTSSLVLLDEVCVATDSYGNSYVINPDERTWVSENTVTVFKFYDAGIRDNRHYYEVHMSSQVFDSYYYYTYHTFQIKPSGNSEWWTHNVTHQSADYKTIVADSMNYSYPVGSEPKNPTVSVKASFSIKNYGSFTLKAVTLSRPESL